MESDQIFVKPSSIIRSLGAIALFLILASTSVQLVSHLTKHNNIYGLVQLFYIDSVRNIPTFYSTFLLLFATLLLGVIIVLKRKQTNSYILQWTILSIGFLYMAADKVVSIHDVLIRPTRMLFGNGHPGIFYFAWGIPGIALLLALALFFIRFMLHLPLKTKTTFLIAAAIYIGGAIGFELIGSRYLGSHGDNWIYKTISTVEESLEMAGVIIFIQALLVYIADNYKELRVQFGQEPGGHT